MQSGDNAEILHTILCTFSPIEDSSVKKYKLGVSNHIDVGEKICTQQLW